MTKRRSFSDKFKATVALEALRGDRTAQEIAAKHKVHPTQVTTWKRQAIDGLTGVFSDKVRRAEDNEAEVKISMDGRGRYLDNIFIERLWRSLKQEAVYLHELQDGFQAKRVIKDWINFYNTERPHTALDKRPPDDAFFDTEPNQKAA